MVYFSNADVLMLLISFFIIYEIYYKFLSKFPTDKVNVTNSSFSFPRLSVQFNGNLYLKIAVFIAKNIQK
jgi:hypothetical protein